MIDSNCTELAISGIRNSVGAIACAGTAKRNREPYKYAKKLLDPPNKSKAAFGKKEADAHFQKTYHHEGREGKYEPPEGLSRPKLPKLPFRTKFATEKKFEECLRKKSDGSAPGLNGISYLVYKRCPPVVKKFFLLLSLI